MQNLSEITQLRGRAYQISCLAEVEVVRYFFHASVLQEQGLMSKGLLSLNYMTYLVCLGDVSTLICGAAS